MSTNLIAFDKLVVGTKFYSPTSAFQLPLVKTGDYTFSTLHNNTQYTVNTESMSVVVEVMS